eukprot:749355-Hanusia_phi.AAC.3
MADNLYRHAMDLLKVRVEVLLPDFLMTGMQEKGGRQKMGEEPILELLEQICDQVPCEAIQMSRCLLAAGRAKRRASGSTRTMWSVLVSSSSCPHAHPLQVGKKGKISLQKQDGFQSCGPECQALVSVCEQVKWRKQRAGCRRGWPTERYEEEEEGRRGFDDMCEEDTTLRRQTLSRRLGAGTDARGDWLVQAICKKMTESCKEPLPKLKVQIRERRGGGKRGEF